MLLSFCMISVPHHPHSKYLSSMGGFVFKQVKENLIFNMNSVFVKLFRLTALESEVLFLSTKQVQHEQQQQCKLHPTAPPRCCKPWPRERPLARVKRLVQSPCSFSRYCGCQREYSFVIVDRYHITKAPGNGLKAPAYFIKTTDHLSNDLTSVTTDLGH